MILKSYSCDKKPGYDYHLRSCCEIMRSVAHLRMELNWIEEMHPSSRRNLKIRRVELEIEAVRRKKEELNLTLKNIAYCIKAEAKNHRYK